MYYVYKVTNLINGKFYVGKRKHKDPYTDKYMGSGKLILKAIEKHGIENFKKEIISIFNTNIEAANLEASLVTKDLVQDNKCYNLHEGGHGGFAHINSLPKEDRVNIKAFKKKFDEGEIQCGGTQHWTQDTYSKVRKQGQENRDAKLTSGWKHTQEWKSTKSKMSSGEGNSQYGSKVCINLQSGEKKRFKEVPAGWIAATELKENKMSSSRRWYNDGTQNFYIYLTDNRISALKLNKGRL